MSMDEAKQRLTSSGDKTDHCRSLRSTRRNATPYELFSVISAAPRARNTGGTQGRPRLRPSLSLLVPLANPGS